MFEYAIVFCLMFFPGYILSRKIFGEKLVYPMSFALSALAYWIGSSIISLFDLDFSLILILPILAATFTFTKKNIRIPDRKVYTIFFGVLLLSFITSYVSYFFFDADGVYQIVTAKSIVGGIPYTTGFADNYFEKITYPQPMSYRPPLNSLLLGVAYFGAGISDASTHAYNGLVLAFFAILLYTIAESKFGEKTAYKAIILLIMVNPFFYSIAYKSQVYTFSAYISLCVYAIWIKKINYKVLGAYAALAYLAHPMSQIFLASMILVETIKFKNTSIPWKEISIGIVLCLIIISPWLIRNYSLFGNPIYTSGKYVMFTRDLEYYFSLEAPKPMRYIEYISNPINFVLLKGGSIWKTFLPPPYSFAFKRIQPHALLDPVSLETTLAGLLSYPILFASIWFLMKNPREKISLLFMLGVFASLIVFGYRVSYTYSLLLPQAMLVAIYAFEKIQNKKWILYLAFAQMLLSAPILFSNDMQYNEDVGYQWIKENIDANQKIMSRHYAMINYVTGHDTIPTPYPGISEIKKVSEKYGIGYYAVNKEDLRLRDFTLSELNESFEYVDESGNFWFYRL